MFLRLARGTALIDGFDHLERETDAWHVLTAAVFVILA
jgi:hypothetical protein